MRFWNNRIFGQFKIYGARRTLSQQGQRGGLVYRMQIERVAILPSLALAPPRWHLGISGGVLRIRTKGCRRELMIGDLLDIAVFASVAAWKNFRVR
jgi:hypothetical protein